MTTTLQTRRPRIFFGWYVIGVILGLGLFAGPTSQAFIGLLVEPISHDTGWSPTEIAGAVTFAGVLAGLGSPLIGLLADRYSPRLLMSIGVLILAASFLLIAASQEVWHLYVGYMLARAVAQNLVSGVVPRVVVVNWFRRMRGRAIGLTGTAHPIGTFAAGPTALLILSAGLSWRWVWVIMGVVVLLVALLPAILIIRRTPGEKGLRPDGDLDTDDMNQSRPSAQALAEVSWTLGQAARTPSFALIMASILLTNFGGGGLPFHLPQYYESQGMASIVGVAAVSMFAISGALANTLWGFLAEHFSERYLGIFTMILGAVLAFGLQFVSHPVPAVAYGALLGVAARGEGSILMLLIANYYGVRSYGVISGMVQTALLVGLAIGPVTMSLIRDATGSYGAVFYAATGTFALAAVLLVLAKKPALPVDGPI